MTDTEAKALALVNEIRYERGRHPVKTIVGFNGSDWDMAFRRAIERLEAAEARHAAELRELKERFSEVLGIIRHKTVPEWSCHAFDELAAPFILPKPDPLVEVCREIGLAPYRPDELRAAIEKRGGKIVWGEG